MLEILRNKLNTEKIKVKLIYLYLFIRTEWENGYSEIYISEEIIRDSFYQIKFSMYHLGKLSAAIYEDYYFCKGMISTMYRIRELMERRNIVPHNWTKEGF